MKNSMENVKFFNQFLIISRGKTFHEELKVNSILFLGIDHARLTLQSSKGDEKVFIVKKINKSRGLEDTKN